MLHSFPASLPLYVYTRLGINMYDVQYNAHYFCIAQLTFGARRQAHRIGFQIKRNNNVVLATCVDHEHGINEAGELLEEILGINIKHISVTEYDVAQYSILTAR